MVKIEAFTIAWNEEKVIGQYIDHYTSIVDHITVFDNFSTDKTVEIARKRGCLVRPFGSSILHDEIVQLKLKEDCWKDSGADWVIVTDIDEFLYHPDFRRFLSETEATVIQPDGHLMVSEDCLPFRQVRTGAKEPLGKTVCFRPSEIKAMNWTPGCHNCSPKGNVKLSVGETKLLHFFLIGRKEFKERWKRNISRFSENDKRCGYGCHYLFSDQRMDDYFNDHLARAEVVW